MRDDIIPALASTDWAVCQVPKLEERIQMWAANGPYSILEDTTAEAGKRLFRLNDCRMPPPLVNAEIGVIINSIRSSLDILVTALSERDGHGAEDKASFPMCVTAGVFCNAGREKIKRLSSADMAQIEKLQPYNPGDGVKLAAIHHLDIVRKHRRLVDVVGKPRRTSITGWGLDKKFQPEFFPWVGLENGTIVARISADAPACEIDFTLELMFRDAGPFTDKPVIMALKDMIDTTQAIVRSFA